MIQPTDNRVLVRRLHQEPKSDVIILTDEPPSKYCEVVAVGPGKIMKGGWRRPLDVFPGDVVFLPGIASQCPDWQEDAIFMVTEDDIGFKVLQEDEVS